MTGAGDQPRAKVLVAEKIGDSGVGLLRAQVDVELGVGWTRDQLAERIGAYDGILIRSATKLDAELLAKATRLRAVGRAGVGVDNVDVEAATKRGIVVANAPQSNVITAAEHTLALLLALARNVPQAHASLTGGAWDRSKFSGIELYEKTLGILGFGRIGQLVAHRGLAFGMRVIAFDPFVSAERYRELGVEQARSSDELYAASDFITLHLPSTPETQGWLDAEALAKCKDGVRILNVARGPLIVTFYRGVWCPYCNMDLHALEAALPQFQKLGASLVAISPQTPPNSRRSQRENKLHFPILSDPENNVAAAFGLRFTLPDYLIDVYKNVFKNNLPLVNGDPSWTLPMPARYLIGQDGTILYAEVNPDYTQRPDPDELIPVLEKLHAVA